MADGIHVQIKEEHKDKLLQMANKLDISVTQLINLMINKIEGVGVKTEITLFSKEKSTEDEETK